MSLMQMYKKQNSNVGGIINLVWMKTKQLCVGVHGCLYVGPGMDWWPVRGVPHPPPEKRLWEII